MVKKEEEEKKNTNKEKNLDKANKRKKTIERQKQEARGLEENAMNRAHEREMQDLINSVDKSDGIRIEIHISNLAVSEMVKAGANKTMPILSIPEQVVQVVCENVGAELVSQATAELHTFLKDEFDSTLGPEPEGASEKKTVKET